VVSDLPFCPQVLASGQLDMRDFPQSGSNSEGRGAGCPGTFEGASKFAAGRRKGARFLFLLYLGLDEI
jgi:hypothetical protein